MPDTYDEELRLLMQLANEIARNASTNEKGEFERIRWVNSQTDPEVQHAH